jgi:hypothetical protein
VAAEEAGMIRLSMRGAFLVAVGLLTAWGGADAQAPVESPPAESSLVPPSPGGLGDAAKALIAGSPWEFSNADRDKICIITFSDEPSPPGLKLEFDRGCSEHFTFIGEVAAWSLSDGDFLRLLSSDGQSVLEFSEVESGIYEAPRPEEGILFIQKPGAAPPPPSLSPDQMAGDWEIRRADKPLCTLTLTTAPAGDALALTIKQPCDTFVTRFGPTTWDIDRGELVVKSARAQFWRFEQDDDGKTWRRIPESAIPLTMVRK